MMREAAARGHRVFALLQEDLLWRGGDVIGYFRELTLTGDPYDWYHATAPEPTRLDKFDAVVMRKDPPFDMEYVYTTYLLERAEQHGVLVVNRCAALRDVSEKAYTMWFPDLTPPTLITRSMAEMRRFLEAHGHIVVKPLDGMGGKSIFVLAVGDPNTGVVLETITEQGGRYAMAQRYVPEIVEGGDKRILVIDGKPYAHALARIPARGESRGNLAAGARGEGRDLTPRDREIAEKVGRVLKDKGILFAGLDVIGDYLTEINVTSPTGVRELDRAYGENICARLFDAIEERLETA
jgi:glutathione synthase